MTATESFLRVARECAEQMVLNANFIRNGLAELEVPDGVRAQFNALTRELELIGRSMHADLDGLYGRIGPEEAIVRGRPLAAMMYDMTTRMHELTEDLGLRWAADRRCLLPGLLLHEAASTVLMALELLVERLEKLGAETAPVIFTGGAESPADRAG